MNEKIFLPQFEESTYMFPHEWQPLIDASLADEVYSIVIHSAERLREPEKVLAIGQEAKIQSQLMSFFYPSSFANGFPSIALLFRALDQCCPGQNWDTIARIYLQKAAQNTQHRPLEQPGMFTGSSGLAFTLSLFCRDDPRYQKTCTALNVGVAQQVIKRHWKRATFGVADKDYDTISGASGVLGYLISLPAPEQVVQDAIALLLDYLVWLCGEDEQKGLMRWFSAPEYAPTPQYLQHYPEGYFNLGLSHGIAGPLAALALAWQAQYRIDRQEEAMMNVSTWIVDHHIQDNWGINWPVGIPLHVSSTPEKWRSLAGTRTAWCYGTPGIARSLWLAGKALQDEGLQQVALCGIESVLRRPISMRDINSPTICHGVAGLLMICLHFAYECEHVYIHEQIPVLVRQLLALYDPGTPLGFRDEEQSGVFIDDPGLLTGVSGVLLVLLATLHASDWERAFLIA